MKNWEEDDTQGHCTAAEDLADAKSICKQLGITLYERNFSAEYWDNVFEYCLSEFRAGRTPNPDVLCNKEIKFKVFLDHALRIGADKIVTGHYARLQEDNGLYRLFKALDKNKDQTYFLHTLSQHQLSKAFFPLGGLNKDEVRRIAEDNNLATSAKKDSTGICFIGERNFKEFLSRYLPAQPGDIRSADGMLLGRHDGLMYYTLGQRKGLGIGGRNDANEQPWYVVAKDLSSNTLIVAQGQDHPLLYSRGLIAQHVHWITGSAPEPHFQCWAKTRYRQPDQACVISDINERQCTVRFNTAQRAVTPGLSVVFFEGDECLGGGIIDRIIQ
jgi:tRNA-specific 2-thiouridylase